MKIIMEVIALSLEDIIIAQENGADRIELAFGLAEGALTPSYGFMELARKISRIPIFPIIRPRHGDAVYSSAEIASMKRDIQVAKETGMDGVVFGVVDKNNWVAVDLMEELIMTAGSMDVTFTRVFDSTPDPLEAMEQLQKFTAIKRILTSGQADSLIAGAAMIKKFQSKAGERFSFMPGLGINPENVVEIVQATGAREFHMGVGLRMPEGPFGTLDGARVRKVRELLDNLS
ncbi:MAG: hypothetical protein M0T74_10610 [Desulfitobacterium hafniense]|nr:hypothetical protein [Desulfitobacterium hafniense]